MIPADVLSDLFTLLPGPVENLDVLELHTDPTAELNSICGVVFAASFDGTVGVSPEQKQDKCFRLHNDVV